MRNVIVCGLVFLFSSSVMALESTKPPKTLNSVQIGLKVGSKIVKNSHFRLKGMCLWLTKKFPPKLETLPATSQFVPDLLVTVSNLPGENPWFEARNLVENKVAMSAYNRIYQSATGFPLGFGNNSTIVSPAHLNDGQTRIVSVFATPLSSVRFPFIAHKPETAFNALYYSSLSDATMERTQMAELAYMATHPTLLFNHEIGTATNHWGVEIPRMMHITQPSRFRASVVAAMHAADIVTNKKSLHFGRTTKNRCGTDCIVANVTYDPQQKQVIWQEVYPINRNIIPGDPNDFGLLDEQKGNGNYIFVVWRKYTGCVELKGKLISGVGMGQPQKR